MKKLIVGCAIVIVAIIGISTLNQSKNENTIQSSSTSGGLIPVDEITHGHGIAVDIADSNRVYIATHHGLLLLQDESELYRVGDSKDDYMGFSPHPTNSNVFFSSGHPRFGGNIGIQKTVDGGFTWEKISDGIDGPVDFHAMTISPVNPDLILGWYKGAIQRSIDGGKTWNIVSRTNIPVISLAADTKNENVVYAASPQGLMVSKDKGGEWRSLIDGFVSTIAVNPQDSQRLISFSEKYKLAISKDSGKNWEPVNEHFQGETPLHTAFDRQKPNVIYTITEKNSVYRSKNGGTTWSKIK